MDILPILVVIAIGMSLAWGATRTRRSYEEESDEQVPFQVGPIPGQGRKFGRRTNDYGEDTVAAETTGDRRKTQRGKERRKGSRRVD